MDQFVGTSSMGSPATSSVTLPALQRAELRAVTTSVLLVDPEDTEESAAVSSVSPLLVLGGKTRSVDVALRTEPAGASLRKGSPYDWLILRGN